MTTGSIKWYSNSKGFGFIEDEIGRSVFLHFSALIDDGQKLTEGTKVKFDLVETEKGPEAAQVTVVTWEEP